MATARSVLATACSFSASWSWRRLQVHWWASLPCWTTFFCSRKMPFYVAASARNDFTRMLNCCLNGQRVSLACMGLHCLSFVEICCKSDLPKYWGAYDYKKRVLRAQCLWGWWGVSHQIHAYEDAPAGKEISAQLELQFQEGFTRALSSQQEEDAYCLQCSVIGSLALQFMFCRISFGMVGSLCGKEYTCCIASRHSCWESLRCVWVKDVDILSMHWCRSLITPRLLPADQWDQSLSRQRK